MSKITKSEEGQLRRWGIKYDQCKSNAIKSRGAWYSRTRYMRRFWKWEKKAENCWLTKFHKRIF